MTGDLGRKIAVWTPELSGVNGQNMVTRRVVESQEEFLGTVFEYPGNTLASIPRTLWLAARLALSVVRGQHSTVYLVCSRSSIGFFRDTLPLFTSRLGARVIVHVHGSDFPELLERPVIGRFARWLYAPCDVVVPSQHLLAPLAGHSFRQLLVCENFADVPAAFVPQSQALRSDAFVVLWNSNVMASKGIFELVQGLRLLRQDGVAIKLIVLGKAIGDTEQSAGGMRDFLETLSGESWIDIKGSVPPEEVPQLIDASDIIALPSTYSSECQPLAVIQGMLAGRPVLVCNTAAMRATVGEYPATFVERHPASIADALRPLIRCREKTTFAEAAALLHERFSPAIFDACIQKVLIEDGTVQK